MMGHRLFNYNYADGVDIEKWVWKVLNKISDKIVRVLLHEKASI